MSRRGLIGVAAVLVVLALLAVLGQRANDGGGSHGERFVPGLEQAVNDIERVTLTSAGGRIVATLERRPEAWVVAEKNGYRADVAKIRELLVGLAEARVVEQKTANPELYPRLGVEDVAGDAAGGSAVAISGGGHEWPVVILGNTEGSKYRYARRAGETQSYLIDRDPKLPRSAAQWLQMNILGVPGARVQRVTITHPDGEVVTISKADPAAANFDVAEVPEGRALQYPGVANVIGNALRELNLEDVRATADAAPGAAETVAQFGTFDGLVVTMRGAKQNDEAWVGFDARFDAEQAAQLSSGDTPDEQTSAEVASEAERINERVSGWRYRIASYQYDQLTRRMADLLRAAE